MTTYIAGPMTGLPGFNHATFARVADELRSQGRKVLSPHEIDGSSTHRTWHWYMREALKMLLVADDVLLLPGWQESRGACIERSIAEALEMPIAEYMGAS